MGRRAWVALVWLALVPAQVQGQWLDSRSWEFCGGVDFVFCASLTLDLYADSLVSHVVNTSGEVAGAERNAAILAWQFATPGPRYPALRMDGWWSGGAHNRPVAGWWQIPGFDRGVLGSRAPGWAPGDDGVVPEAGIASGCATPGRALWITGGAGCGGWGAVDQSFVPWDHRLNLDRLGALSVYAGRMGSEQYAVWSEVRVPDPTVTPEPASLLLLATGLGGGLGALRRRRRV